VLDLHRVEMHIGADEIFTRRLEDVAKAAIGVAQFILDALPGDRKVHTIK
jgi:hypothetical protein